MSDDVLDLDVESLLGPGVDDQSVVVNGSRKILLRGREYAEGSVLSAMKNSRGSDPLSSKDISAEPGPAPLTFPEKASVRMSCPAA